MKTVNRLVPVEVGCFEGVPEFAIFCTGRAREVAEGVEEATVDEHGGP